MPALYTLLYRLQYNFKLWLTNCLVGLRKNSTKNGLAETNLRKIENPKILIIAAGLLGDTTMSVPAIIQAKKIWPNSAITVLGLSHNIELLDGCPYIDDFYKSEIVPFSSSNKKGEKELLKWMELQSFDVSIILLGDQFAKILFDASIPIRVGVKGHLLEACLTHTYDIGSPSTWTPKERLNCLRCIGYTVENIVPKLWATETQLPDNIPQNYIIVHPFGSTRRQWWNLDMLSELALEIYRRYNLKTVIIGGKETIGLVQQHQHIVDVTGTLSLKQLKLVISKSRFVISTDSGPFHIAGALGKKVIGLFRARRPELANIFPNGFVLLGQNQICQRKCKWDECRSEKCEQLYSLSNEQILIKVDNSICQK